MKQKMTPEQRALLMDMLLSHNNYERAYKPLPGSQRQPVECEGAAPIIRIRRSCQRFNVKRSFNHKGIPLP